MVKVFRDQFGGAVTGRDNGEARNIWFMDFRKKINDGCTKGAEGEAGGGR